MEPVCWPCITLTLISVGAQYKAVYQTGPRTNKFGSPSVFNQTLASCLQKGDCLLAMKH